MPKSLNTNSKFKSIKTTMVPPSNYCVEGQENSLDFHVHTDLDTKPLFYYLLHIL